MTGNKVLKREDRKEQEIFKGDKVKIMVGLTVRTGIVISADYDQFRNTYNLEVESEEVGFCYWKQGTDGGSVQLL